MTEFLTGNLKAGFGLTGTFTTRSMYLGSASTNLPPNFEEAIQHLAETYKGEDGLWYQEDKKGDQLRDLQPAKVSSGITQLQIADLTGLTITDIQGTATAVISGNNINIGAGEFSSVVLSDGSYYALQFVAGTSISGNQSCTIIGDITDLAESIEYRSYADEFGFNSSSEVDYGVNYNGDSLDLDGIESNSTGSFWNDDGTILYVCGANSDLIQQLDAVTPYKVAGATVSKTVSRANPQDMYISPDGIYLFWVAGTTLTRETMTTPWDIDTLSDPQTGTIPNLLNVYGIAFSDDATKLIACGGLATTERVYQYTLAGEYDISTITYGSNLLVTVGTPLGCKISPDGKELYFSTISSGTVYRYDLPTANSLVGASANGTFDATPSTNPRSLDIVWGTGQTYICDASLDYIYGYDSSTIEIATPRLETAENIALPVAEQVDINDNVLTNYGRARLDQQIIDTNVVEGNGVDNYIDTLYSPTNLTRIECGFQLIGNPATNAKIFGTRAAPTAGPFLFFGVNSSDNFYGVANTSSLNISEFGPYDNDYHDWVFDAKNGVVLQDGVEYGTLDVNTFSIAPALHMLAENSSAATSNEMAGQCGYLRIYEDDILIADYSMAEGSGDTVYDRVSGQGQVINGDLTSVRATSDYARPNNLLDGFNVIEIEERFITTWETTTDAEDITIPTNSSYLYNGTIEWYDSSDALVSSEIFTYSSDPNLTTTLPTAGTYTCYISGTFQAIRSNYNLTMAAKLRTVENLGVVGWATLEFAFRDANNMTSFTAGTSDTSLVTNARQMFYSADNLVDINMDGMDLSGVTTLNGFAQNAINLTNVSMDITTSSSLTDVRGMFTNAESVVGLDLSSMDVSGVTTMESMVADCTDLSSFITTGWDTSSVTSMETMFDSCPSLVTLNAEHWDTSSVATMEEMFIGCSLLENVYISNWDVSGVTNMGLMFFNCDALRELDIYSWNIGSVTNMTNFLFASTGLNASSYSDILINFASQTVNSGISFHGGGSKYNTAGGVARASLIADDSWTITDGGAE